MLILVLAIAIFSMLGGWAGWSLGTRALNRQSFDALDPAHFNSVTAPEKFAQRRQVRLLMVVAGACFGAVLSVLFLAIMAP